MSLSRTLERIRAYASTGPAAPAVCIFDLDSTLYSTQERNLAILREYVARPEAPATLRQIVDALDASCMNWNPMEDVYERGFTDERGQRALRRYWFERFFSNEYVKHDLPMPGAVEYVRAVHEAGAFVVYLTGRPDKPMGEGTRASLLTHGFPLDERARLVLKPEFGEHDLAFKRRALEEIRPVGPVLAAFENEPANANLFHDAFPDADIFFLETVCSPDPPPLRERILRVKDFKHGGE
jgi:phosphoglycolate phosphatase-like HAD superfamily hydrolase